VSWSIDSEGIHITAQTLCEAEQDMEQIARRLTTTPRTVGEKNAESMRTFMEIIGAKKQGILGAPQEERHVFS
jgi:hypothetical protein